MSRIKRTAIRAPLPVVLMAVIFFLSAQPDLDSGLGALDLVLRKIAHVVAFGTLTALWWWALRPSPSIRRPLGLAAGIALLYAISDEYHQSFVEGRSGSAIDVGVDAIGVLVAALLLRYDQRVRLVLERSGGNGGGSVSERRVAMSSDRRPAGDAHGGAQGARGAVRGGGDRHR